jgi:hypothetical protein
MIIIYKTEAQYSQTINRKTGLFFHKLLPVSEMKEIPVGGINDNILPYML